MIFFKVISIFNRLFICFVSPCYHTNDTKKVALQFELILTKQNITKHFFSPITQDEKGLISFAICNPCANKCNDTYIRERTMVVDVLHTNNRRDSIVKKYTNLHIPMFFPLVVTSFCHHRINSNSMLT